AWYNAFYIAFAAGRWSEAIEGCLALQRQDAFSGYIAACIAALHSFGSPSNPAEALRWLERATGLAPDAFLTMSTRILAHQASGNWPATCAAGDAALAFGRSIEHLTLFGLAAAEAGETALARDFFDEIQLRSRREYVSPMFTAALAAALGE